MHWIWERWELWQSLKLDLSSSSKLELLWGTAAKLIEVSQLAGDLILPPATAGAAPRLWDGDNPSPGRSPDDIMHRKAFQGEDHRCQAGPPDLRHGVVWHALLPELPAVQSVAFPRRRPAGPASSLLGFTPAQKKPHPTSKPLIPPVTIQRKHRKFSVWRWKRYSCAATQKSSRARNKEEFLCVQEFFLSFQCKPCSDNALPIPPWCL